MKKHSRSQQTKITLLLNAIRAIVKTKDKQFLIASILLHVVLFSVLLVSWKSSDPVKITPVPNSVQARVISQNELQVLRSKRAAEQKKILDKKGILHIEVAYLPEIIKKFSYDTFCQEHYEYYSMQSLMYMCKMSNMKILDVEFIVVISVACV